LRSINVEIKSLPAADAPEWEAKAKKYDEQISKLNQDIEWAENTTSQGGNKAEVPVNKKSTDCLIHNLASNVAFCDFFAAL
jgi:hypothetical protein